MNNMLVCSEMRFDDCFPHCWWCCSGCSWWSNSDWVIVGLQALLPNISQELVQLLIIWWFLITENSCNVVQDHSGHDDRKNVITAQTNAILHCWKPALQSTIRALYAIPCRDLSGVVCLFCISCWVGERSEQIPAAGVPTISDQVSMAWCSLQLGPQEAVVEDRAVVNRTRPASDNIRYVASVVTHQLNIYGKISFPVSVDLSIISSGWLYRYMRAVYSTNDAWHLWRGIEDIHRVLSLLLCRRKVHVLRSQSSDGFCYFVHHPTDSGFADCKGVTNHQLKRSCGVESKCHQQLVHWCDAVIAVGCELQEMFYLHIEKHQQFNNLKNMISLKLHIANISLA